MTETQTWLLKLLLVRMLVAVHLRWWSSDYSCERRAPFHQIQAHVTANEVNEINMTYTNDKSCSNITSFMTHMMHQQTAAKMLWPITSLPSSTPTCASKKCGIVYVHIIIAGLLDYWIVNKQYLTCGNYLRKHLEGPSQHFSRNKVYYIYLSCYLNFGDCSYILYHFFFFF